MTRLTTKRELYLSILLDVGLSDVDAEDLDSFLEELDMDAETRDKVKQEKKRLEDEAKRQKQLEAGLSTPIEYSRQLVICLQRNLRRKRLSDWSWKRKNVKV